jgi:hypothetical protein
MHSGCIERRMRAIHISRAMGRVHTHPAYAVFMLEMLRLQHRGMRAILPGMVRGTAFGRNKQKRQRPCREAVV